MNSSNSVYGLMAEFSAPEKVLYATRKACEGGYRELDAYSPYPVEGLAEALGMRRSRLPSVILVGGLVGAAAGYFMQYYAMAVDYKYNAGGKPYHSWPAFIPITFELMILIASLSAVLGLLIVTGLPRPHHPVFDVPQFVRSSQDRFFLCIKASDSKFDLELTTQFLASFDLEGQVITVPASGAVTEQAPEIYKQNSVATEVATPTF